MIHRKPAAEFQFVKVLVLDELVSYLKWFERKEIHYTCEEVNAIAQFLLQSMGGEEDRQIIKTTIEVVESIEGLTAENFNDKAKVKQKLITEYK